MIGIKVDGPRGKWGFGDYVILAALIGVAVTANAVWWAQDRLRELKEKRKP